ncbi:2-dehydropantoate 2-reductase [Ornithinibacillus gellani]|nr:2-dehydropantoate 2-reductase [Ornithinibacillus gellani]
MFATIEEKYRIGVIGMHIGIIGGGAIGLLLASYFRKEHPVTLYVRREEQRLNLMEQGLTLDSKYGDCNVDVALIQDIHAQDLYIICVKQHQLQDVMPALYQVAEGKPIVFLQNGMGHIEKFQSPAHFIYAGIVEHGAIRVSDTNVHHTGSGRIAIAKVSGDGPSASELAVHLHQLDFRVEAADDWRRLLSEKLIINAVINPLTALFQVRNGEILKNSFIRNIARELCKESARALRLSESSSWERVEQIAMATSENISSMYKDIQEGRKTEIDSMTGYLLQNYNYMPYTKFVDHAIRALELKQGDSDA